MSVSNLSPKQRGISDLTIQTKSKAKLILILTVTSIVNQMNVQIHVHMSK